METLDIIGIKLFVLCSVSASALQIVFSNILYESTLIPRLTSDPANEDFFRCFLDSANECFSGCVC